MKRAVLLLWMAFLLAASPATTHAQLAVEYARVFKSKSLSGTIRIKLTNESLNAVLVEEMMPNWRTVVSSTRTDVNGHFLIPTSYGKSLHYLRLSGNGLSTTGVTVRISKWAKKKELTLFISVAT